VLFLGGEAEAGQSSSAVLRRVAAAVRLQRTRYKGCAFSRNAHIPAGLVERFCAHGPEGRTALQKAAVQYRRCCEGDVYRSFR